MLLFLSHPQAIRKMNQAEVTSYADETWRQSRELEPRLVDIRGVGVGQSTRLWEKVLTGQKLSNTRKPSV